MDGGESARLLHELNELVVVIDNPMFAVRARDGRPKGERLTVLIKIEDGVDRSGEAGELARVGEGRDRSACGGGVGVERGLRTR